MADGSTSTLFVNQTGNVVNMMVGNTRSSAPIASIVGGGQFRMAVNMNDTYREFLVGVGSDAGKTVVVTSDDCCDYQCITIKEIADGTIDLLREPRHHQQQTDAYGTTGKLDQMTSNSLAAKKPWFAWKMWV